MSDYIFETKTSKIEEALKKFCKINTDALIDLLDHIDDIEKRLDKLEENK